MKAKKHIKKPQRKIPAKNTIKYKQKKQTMPRTVSLTKKHKSIPKKSKHPEAKLKTKKTKSLRAPEEIIIHQEIIPQEILSDYIFAFELTRPYPVVRSYIIKQPLKKPVKDILFELFGTSK